MGRRSYEQILIDECIKHDLLWSEWTSRDRGEFMVQPKEEGRGFECDSGLHGLLATYDSDFMCRAYPKDCFNRNSAIKDLIHRISYGLYDCKEAGCPCLTDSSYE